MHIYSDFDGTISIEDATDVILSRFADPKWKVIEARWKRGEIGSAECMAQQIPLIHASRQELDSALDAIAIDTDFVEFSHYCRREKLPLTIISDGVDYFIRRILARHQLDYLPVIANKLTIRGYNGHTSYHLTSPFSSSECESASGVCKCKAVRSLDTCIYIGDGRSDFCVSDKPDMVFAKGKLASFCAEQHTPYIPYQQFGDVLRQLKDTLPALRNYKQHANTYAFV